MTELPTVFDEQSDTDITLPHKWEVCPNCGGKGTFNDWVITADEWWGPDWDDESREDYLAGTYDQVCDECNGRTTVAVVDEQKCDPTLLARYHQEQRELADLAAMEAAERRMGA